MSQVDVVQLVRDGKARYEWHWITSVVGDLWLRIAVLRDAMKFDGVPELDWFRRPLVQPPSVWRATGRIFDGVRLPASAGELQQIADLIGGWMLTPKVIDLIWLQAGLKFDAIINSGAPYYKIAATSDIAVIHERVEKRIAELGGDDGTKLVSCVGKYWCLINELEARGKVQGDWAACNYGWFAKTASGPGLSPGTRCWQRPGYAHNKLHLDPSQTIRLMWMQGELSRDGGKSFEDINMLHIATDPELAPLITWDGKPLQYLRQRGVEAQPMSGKLVLPPVTISGAAS